MLEKMSMRIAQYFYKNGIIEVEAENDVKVYAYGFELLIAVIMEIGAILIISVFIGQFYNTVAFLMAFIPVRTYAGGYHAQTHWGCFLVLLVVYAIFLVILYITPAWLIIWLILGSLGISIATVYKLAPIADENKPITDRQSKRYRQYSLFIVTYQTLFIVLLILEGTQSPILFSFSMGVLSAALSLIAANIKNKREGGLQNGCEKSDEKSG